MKLHQTALACLTILLSTPLLLAGGSDNRLDIYWVDVEGGAATLIVTPDDEAVLIVKTTASNVDELTAAVKTIHSYDCPCGKMLAHAASRCSTSVLPMLRASSAFAAVM